MNPDEIERALLEDDSDGEILNDFSDESDDLYEPPKLSDEYSVTSDEIESILFEDDSDGESEDNFSPESNEPPKLIDGDSATIPEENTGIISWSHSLERFIPRKSVSTSRRCSTAIQRNSSALEIFHNLFPKSLLNYIAQCTNERLDIYEKSQQKKQKYLKTNSSEIQVILGCMIIMSYNRVPAIADYWSNHPSLGNQAIKSAIARDRFQLITSKMYFAPPQKPDNSSKTYYVDDIVECFKTKFMKCRQDSPHQSIDESMTSFKGRSTLKQYMPLKPTKRGIKMWLRCDAETGYTYDFNIYAGKEFEAVDGTLGERVVYKLASSISEPDVTLCFDRFFTSVNLLQNIKFAALGTCMSNKKNIPKIEEKLKRGEARFRSSTSGLLFVKWQDTKEVLLLSNCHMPNISTVQKTQKNGEKCEIPCPEMIKFYREIMGGVDRADQMSTLYDHDRKSTKWWKKVFYRLLMMSCVNAWIIQCDLNRRKKSFKSFLGCLAEKLIEESLKTAAVRRSTKPGRLPRVTSNSKHLPIQGETRRRCTRCSQNKKQTRTETICSQCNVPLCRFCFAPYHN